VSQFAWNYRSLQLPTYHLPTSIKVTFSGAPTPAPAAKSIEELTACTEQIHRLRDGELILFRRSDSRIWQYKFKRDSGSWYRASTRKSVLEHAKRVAMDLHDEARYRERLGLAPAHKSFKDIAMATVEDMQRDLAAGTGKKIYVDYCSVIERYFIPYFGDKYLQNLKHKDIADFEAWRNHRMARTPKSSTLMTFASAFTRIDMTLSRMTCFNLFMPGSIKQNIEVVMMDLSKRELLAYCDWNVISFLTYGSGRHLVKIKF